MWYSSWTIQLKNNHLRLNLEISLLILALYSSILYLKVSWWTREERVGNRFSNLTFEFIALVHERPPLWQKEHRNFTNRDVRLSIDSLIALSPANHNVYLKTEETFVPSFSKSKHTSLRMNGMDPILNFIKKNSLPYKNGEGSDSSQSRRYLLADNYSEPD